MAPNDSFQHPFFKTLVFLKKTDRQIKINTIKFVSDVYTIIIQNDFTLYTLYRQKRASNR